MTIQHKSSNEIPFLEFNFGQHKETLIFFHANAFPPECYIPLIREMGSRFNIICPLFKPLWDNPGRPTYLKDWTPLKDDMVEFLNSMKSGNHFIAGHSLGGHIGLRIAIENPSLVKKIVLLDPIIFPKWQIIFWEIIQWTEFGLKIHPMIKASKNQKLIHKSKIELFDKYRKKKIFKNILDGNLSFLIDGLIKNRDDGQVEIKFPKDWELQIYRAGMISDKQIWKRIKKLDRDVLLLHAEKTHAPNINVINSIADQSKLIIPELLKGYSHFFPFEIPKDIGKKMMKFLI